MAENTELRFELYYSPTSYYSHKAQLALYEKGEDFRGITVNVRVGEGMERWFMLINPLGQVPVLKDGDVIIPDSDVIIDYIDKQLPQDPKLVPSLETDVGKTVDRFRKLLVDQVPIAHITHGTWYNPELAPEDARSPWNKAEWEDYFKRTLARLAQLAEENLDLREAYNQKLDFYKSRIEVVRDSAQVKQAIDSLHPVFDQVEEQLLKVTEESDGESWLCGKTFTVADISLVELLNRLTRLGLISLFTSSDKRSAIYRYWQQAQKRPSFIKVKENEKRLKAQAPK